MHTLFLSFVLLAFFSGKLFADEEVPHALPDKNNISYWGIQYENDFLGGRSDKYYSQGLEISYAKQGDTPNLLVNIADVIPTYEVGQRHGVTYLIGQKVFTPEDIQNPELQADDRPYAGYLYGAVNYINSVELTADLQHVNFLELSIGLIGPDALGEDVQNYLHEMIKTDLAEGWDHQLHNELTLGASYAHKWRHFFNSRQILQTELSPHAAVVIGNVYTYVAGGIMLRWGKGLKRDMGPPNIRPGFLGSTYFVPRFDPNWYFYLGHEIRLVERNIFLDGNTNVDSHRVDKRNLVGDLVVGFAFHVNKMRFAISHIIRSKEFEQQPEYSKFGSLNFTYYF